MDVTSNMLGSSIQGGEPTVSGSHGSHGDKGHEHPPSECDHGATTLVMRAAFEVAILKNDICGTSRTGATSPLALSASSLLGMGLTRRQGSVRYFAIGAKQYELPIEH